MIYDSLSEGKSNSRKSRRARSQFEDASSLVRDEKKRNSHRGDQRDKRTLTNMVSWNPEELRRLLRS